MVEKSKSKIAKKQTKKKVVKKKSKKISAKNNVASNVKFVTKKVTKDRCFVLANGNNIFSLKELAIGIGNMTDDVFYYHVSEHRNDFSRWILDVVHEKELATSLEKVRLKNEFQLLLLEYIVKKIK